MYEGYTLVFDIDGTICPIKKKGEEYSELVPYNDIIEKLRKCHEEGARIILFSSRNMNSYDGNIGLINKFTIPVLVEWLKKWNIPYDEIVMGKVWPGHKGFYVDDRSVRPDEFLTMSLDELNQLCEKSRSKEIE